MINTAVTDIRKRTKYNLMKSLVFYLSSLIFILWSNLTYACTVVSAIAKNGQVWTMNNEDGYLGIANFINVFPATENNKYGYYTLSYFSPEWGKDGRIQGGMNEKGLTFDFNTIDQVDFDFTSRKSFPKGDNAILPHILGNLSTVDEVITFFNTYWFQGGFTSAQMHVADRHGNFAIISASGVIRSKDGEPMISTNFDLCGNQDGSFCWRYPVAENILKVKEASYETMLKISQKTTQGESTLYTNIQNLSTGDIWFMSKHDPGMTVKINIAELIKKGRKSFTFSDLNSLKENRPEYQKQVVPELKNAPLYNLVGVFSNPMIGQIDVKETENKLMLTFADNTTALFYPVSKKEFHLQGEDDIKIIFKDEIEFALFENGFWSFTATRKELQPISVLNFGTFHMGYTPDENKTKYYGKTEDLRKEVHAIARMLARFRPTVILVEVSPEYNQALMDEYSSYLENPSKIFPAPQEIDLLAYELGRLSGTERIYGIDHSMDYDYYIESKISNHLDPLYYNHCKSNRIKYFSKKVHNIDSLDVYSKLVSLNSDDYLNYLIYINADKLTHVGTEKGYEGADEAAKFYQRNLRMYSNLNRIELDENDRVFILMGATHTAYFRDFIKKDPKYELVNTLEYLKK